MISESEFIMKTRSRLKFHKMKRQDRCCTDGPECDCEYFPYRDSKKLTDMALINPHMSFYKNPWWRRLRCKNCSTPFTNWKIYDFFHRRRHSNELHNDLMRIMKNLDDTKSDYMIRDSYMLKDYEFRCDECDHAFAGFDINFSPRDLWVYTPNDQNEWVPNHRWHFGYNIEYVELGYTCIDLTILCKTFSQNGFCYIGKKILIDISIHGLLTCMWIISGFDSKANKLVRPIFNERVRECCWPKHTGLRIGSTYTFKHLDQLPSTVLPHKQNDLIVREDYTVSENVSDLAKDLFSILKPLATDKMTNIFGNGNIIDASRGTLYVEGRCFISEKTNCPSVGILKLKISALGFVPHQGKIRLAFHDGENYYSVSCTSINWELDQKEIPRRNPNEDVLMMIGAGRGLENFSWNNPRCYLVCTAIYFKPQN